MRRLRLLVAIPLVASLLLVASGGAQAAGPRGPSLAVQPADPGTPYLNFGFPCHSPNLDEVVGFNGTLTTTDDYVFLWQQSNPLNLFGSNANFDVMKCIFLYPAGTVIGAPYTLRNFQCSYQAPWGLHFFANSVIFVRDTWAVLICAGTGQEENLLT